MQIKVWTGFSKRINSTKQPTGGTTVDVYLKEECDIKSPHFILASPMYSINYVQAFGNYYFADVTNLDGHRCEINCTLDHLATFKSNISSYSGLVKYAASSTRKDITDPRNSPTVQMIHSHTDLAWTAGSASFNQTGTYILTYLSNQSGGSGLVKYAAMDWYALSQFAADFFTNTVIDELVKQFTNPTDALVSLHWLPIAYNDIPGSITSSLTVGNQAITLSDSQAKIITSRVLTLETSAVVALVWPGLPYDFNIRETYIAKAPYTTIELFLPFIGNVPLSDDLIAYLDTGFKLTGAIDILTGDLFYNAIIGSEKAAFFNGNCATHMPIASASYNAFGVVSGALTAVGGLAAAAGVVATGGGATPLIAAGASVVGGAASAAKSAVINTQINGSNSSAVGSYMGMAPRITIFTSVAAEPNITAYQSAHGLPYFQVATLSSLSGYIECADASVAIAGDGNEQSVVNGYLNSGFYLE